MDLSALFSSSGTESVTLSLGNTILILLAALVLGTLISLIYMYTHKRQGYTASFPVTLIMLPAIISIIILLVGNSVARAFSLAGAFTLIRFRSAPGDPKDIAYVFFSVAVGLACGMGYLGYAALFAVILCGTMVLLDKLHYAAPKENAMTLKITIPEDMNYQGLFDDLLAKNTSHWHLKKVRTTSLGTLFELVYHVTLKKECDQKALIDQIRCRNGNLDVSLSLREMEETLPQ